MPTAATIDAPTARAWGLAAEIAVESGLGATVERRRGAVDAGFRDRPR